MIELKKRKQNNFKTDKSLQLALIVFVGYSLTLILLGVILNAFSLE